MNIYVGSLPPNTTAKALLAYFDNLVRVIELKRIKNKGKKSPGYATLKVRTKQEFDLILTREHYIKGHKLAVKAYLTPKERLKLEKNCLKRRVYIKNLPNNASVDELTSLFSQFGKVDSVIIKQKEYQRVPYGFVTFLSQKSAELSLEEGFVEYKGKDIEILMYQINGLKFRNEISKEEKEKIVGIGGGMRPCRKSRVYRCDGNRFTKLEDYLGIEYINQIDCYHIGNSSRRAIPQKISYYRSALMEKFGLCWIQEKMILRSLLRKESIITKKHDSFNLRFNKGNFVEYFVE